MSTPTQITSSASSSQSQASLLGGKEEPDRSHQLVPSRPTMPGRSGSSSVVHVRAVSEPTDYLLPGVAPGSYVLYAIAGVRIYHSTQLTSNHTGALSFGRGRSKDKKNGSQWVYSHLKGKLVFGRDKSNVETEATTTEAIASSSRGEAESNGEWWFQLVDNEADKVVWKFKLPLSPGSKFNYELDRPFFHVFQGSSRKYGFLFVDDKESEAFSSEVTIRTKSAVAALCTSSSFINESMTLTLEPITAKPSKGRSRSLSNRSNKKLKLKEPSSFPAQAAGVSGVIVSSPTPNSFKHIAHIGFNQNSGAIETSKNLDPAFREILADLRMQTGSDVTENVILEHLDFVQGFWKDASAIQRSASSRPIPAN